MILDLEPDPDGNIEIVETDGVLVAVVHPVGQVDLLGALRYRPHWATCPDAEAWRRDHGVPDPAPRFDGATIAEDPDATVRLGGQLLAVYEAMSDGHEHSIAWLAEAAGGTHAAVSARLRDLRKPKFGGHTVERRHAGDGLWLYRLLLTERVS